MAKKRLFQALDELNVRDAEQGSSLVGVCPTLVSMDYGAKTGTRVTMGVPGNMVFDVQVKKDPIKTVEDLQKAKWYLEREISRISNQGLDPMDDGSTIIDKVATGKTYEFLKTLAGLKMDSEEHKESLGSKAATIGVRFYQIIREPYNRTYNILEVLWGDGSETREILIQPKD